MNTPLAYLSLKTTDINSSVTLSDYYNTTTSNSVGVITNNRCNITWNKIDMRKVLGDEMFYKYNKFNIGLTSLGFSACGSYAEAASNRNLMIKLKGLNFTNGQSNEVVLTTISHSTAAYTGFAAYDVSTQYFTFDKQDYIDFNIVLHTVYGNTYPIINDATSILGQQVYNFVIIPVA